MRIINQKHVFVAHQPFNCSLWHKTLGYSRRQVKPLYYPSVFILYSWFTFSVRNTSGYIFPATTLFGYYPSITLCRNFRAANMSPKEMIDNNADDTVNSKAIADPLNKKRRSATSVKTINSDDITDEPTTTRKRRNTSKKNLVEKDEDDDTINESQESNVSTSKKKGKAVSHQILTERDELPKLWNADKAMANGSYSELLGRRVKHKVYHFRI
jgi:hypothetical protein